MASRMDRCYGFFRCTNCGKHWESSHVYTNADQHYEQDCRSCKTSCQPYKTEMIHCSQCGQEQCTCTKEELSQKRHVNPNRPHRRDLCQKCRAGFPCSG